MRKSCEKKIAEELYWSLLDYAKKRSVNGSKEFFKDEFNFFYSQQMSTLFLCSSEKNDLGRFFTDYLNRIHEIAICHFTDIQHTEALPNKNLSKILEKIGKEYLKKYKIDENLFDSIIKDSINSLGQEFIDAFYKELNLFSTKVNKESIDEYKKLQKEPLENKKNYDIETINPKSQPNDNYDELFSDIENDKLLLLADSKPIYNYDKYSFNSENDERQLLKQAKDIFGEDYLERMKFMYKASLFEINTEKELAEIIGSSSSTIRSHRSRIAKKWNDYKIEQIKRRLAISNSQLNKIQIEEKIEEKKNLIINYIRCTSNQKLSKEEFNDILQKNYPLVTKSKTC